jgi:hypothetical protein
VSSGLEGVRRRLRPRLRKRWFGWHIRRIVMSIHTDRELVERERGHRSGVAASNVLTGFGRRGLRDQR